MVSSPPETEPALDLREATDADQALLAELYRSTRDDLASLGDGAAVASLIAMQQRVHAEGRRRQFPGARQLLLYSGGRCVAQLVLDRGPRRLHLVDIAVLPEARGQGFGRALLRWAQRQAADAGVPLDLRVRRDNHTARLLYLELGFRAGAGDDVFEPMRWEPAADAQAPP
ncbi:MAG TPA: GNAT family N-acetyltransferase [Duganella sp.]|uniref:GNAT family N-acetyltransferase n=1 Tax=Duganella sp. TaxID=1904440 RepID=UPI002ED25C9B